MLVSATEQRSKDNGVGPASLMIFLLVSSTADEVPPVRPITRVGDGALVNMLASGPVDDVDDCIRMFE